MGLLRGRWLYILLFAALAVSYVRTFHATRHTPRAATAQAAPKQLPDPTIDRGRMAALLQQRPGLGIVLLGWGALGLGLSCAGFILTGRALSSGRLRKLLRGPSHLPSRWAGKEAKRVFALLVFLVAGWPMMRMAMVSWGIGRSVDVMSWSVVSMLILDLLVILIVWAFATESGRSMAKTFGVSLRRAPEMIRRGLTGYAAVFPWLFGLLWLSVAVFEYFGIHPPLEPIQELLFLERRPWVVSVTVVLACVIGPIAEELFFRGVLFSSMRKKLGRPSAVLLSSVLFSLLHTNLIGFVPILALGAFLALLYERTGSLVASIAVHITHNALLIGFGLTLRELL